jgi:mannose-6-phosphate isomerase-like protein (cupin superfamily)
MWEIFFAQSGDGAIDVDGTEHSLPAGTCVAVAPGETHELRNPGRENLVVLYFGIRS